MSDSWTQTGTALQAFAPVVWAGQRLTPHSATPCPGQGRRGQSEGPGERAGWLATSIPRLGPQHPSPPKATGWRDGRGQKGPGRTASCLGWNRPAHRLPSPSPVKNFLLRMSTWGSLQGLSWGPGGDTSPRVPPGTVAKVGEGGKAGEANTGEPRSLG